jgi:putative Mg2+ transporter-C (MgtC) family protein
VVAALCGMIVGIDREWRRRPAGLRTHMLVSLASAAFALIAHEMAVVAAKSDVSSSPDPTRVVEAVTAGAAFLAAGTIFRSNGNIQGITTGASIWLAAAMGAACGVGFYTIAGVSLILALVILVVVGGITNALGTNESPPADPPSKD